MNKIFLLMLILFSINNYATIVVSKEESHQQSRYGRSRDIGQWCNNKIFFLEENKRYANDLYAIGRHEQAYNQLKQGLEDALDGDFGYTHLQTNIVIARGLDIAKAVEDSNQLDNKTFRALSLYLDEYYTYVMDVIQSLELPYYNRTWNGRGSRYSRGINMRNFDDIWIKLSKAQVELVINTLTRNYVTGYGTEIHAITPNDLYLRALQKSILGFADDLADTLFASRYSCTVNQLDSLSARLEDFLADGSGYIDIFHAVVTSYESISRILSDVGPCYSSMGQNTAPYSFHDNNIAYDHDIYDYSYHYTKVCNHCGDGRTTNNAYPLLENTYRLNKYSLNTFYLGQPQRVVKLIMKLKRSWSNTKLEVMVNGEVKRVIYPAKGVQTYSIDLYNCDTSEIQINTNKGGVRIYQIYVYN